MRIPDENDPTLDLQAYQSALVADLDRVCARDRWGRALMILGWIHLAFFGVCQALYRPSVHGDLRHVVLWVLEVATLVGVLRLALGRGWYRATPLAGVIVRVWGTFLILAFNLATFNSLTGWDLNWFKLGWATLSTFGFATMAWLVTPRFLIPAVQMWLTGLLMVRDPGRIYLIYGVSWWLALQGIGLTLERRRARGAIGRLDPAEVDSESEAVEVGA